METDLDEQIGLAIVKVKAFVDEKVKQCILELDDIVKRFQEEISSIAEDDKLE